MSVYFLRVGRYIKVGFSENPERRMDNIWQSGTRYGRPWDLSLHAEIEPLAVIDGDKQVERRCHQALADFLSGCEWFIDEPPVREFIARAQEGDITPVSRPEGEFIPVDHTQMLAERRMELDRWLTRARRRRSA